VNITIQQLQNVFHCGSEQSQQDPLFDSCKGVKATFEVNISRFDIFIAAGWSKLHLKSTLSRLTLRQPHNGTDSSLGQILQAWFSKSKTVQITTNVIVLCTSNLDDRTFFWQSK
jgi:hypothetical protein